MKIHSQKELTTLQLQVEGRLDTTTAPQLEEALGSNLIGITKLIIDFTTLDYISSAGLRLLLTAHKTMIKQDGQMVIRGANAEVQEVFLITGFSEILNIEENQFLYIQAEGDGYEQKFDIKKPSKSVLKFYFAAISGRG